MTYRGESGGYHVRVFCPCGGFNDAPAFGNSWVTKTHYPVCPSCGDYSGRYETETVRWVSGAEFWKPWTWARGRWETPEGPLDFTRLSNKGSDDNGIN